MSKVTTYKCDRCGKTIDYWNRATVQTTGFPDGDFDGDFDFCANCAKTIRHAMLAILTGRRRECPYCEAVNGGVRPLVDDGHAYADLDPLTRQLYAVRRDGATERAVYVDIVRCPMCGRAL